MMLQMLMWLRIVCVLGVLQWNSPHRFTLCVYLVLTSLLSMLVLIGCSMPSSSLGVVRKSQARIGL